MSFAPDTLRALAQHGFDTVIDVRSPSEFAEDRVPGAVSLPVLNDAERARVGTIYVQDSPFQARKLGAALVARNAARHIEERLMQHDGGWRPLVYCWRGGQRSGSFAAILKQIGWRAEVLEGGYRRFRRMVVAALYDRDWPGEVVLLDGFTGTAKTEVLTRAGRLGAQVLDLEGLARHRGSVLGPREGGQPSQKAFETGIAEVLAQLDPARPLVVEAESSKVGNLLVPPALWTAMGRAERIEIAAPEEARARYLSRAYSDFSDRPEALKSLLDKLVPFHGHARVKDWQAMVDAGESEALAAALVREHYDPRYAKSRARREGGVSVTLDGGDLAEEALDALARQVAEKVR